MKPSGEMRAISITAFGAPDVLQIRHREISEPGPGQLRVRVRATSVNRADLLQRQGYYPPPPGVPEDIPGLEFAGEVDEVGAGVTHIKKGERVYGLASGGTYAEFVIVHSSTVSPIPERLNFIEAAAIPEAFITAYDAMISQAHLQCGETVLIQAVGSGVGTAAVQIAKAIGARPLGTARSEKKLEPARKLGLENAILVAEGIFAEQVLKATENAGVDVVLELVGGRYVAEDLKCAALNGRIIVVGLVAGTKCDVDLGTVLRKRLMIKGTTLRMRPLAEKIIATELLTRNLNPLFESRQLEPIIDKVMPLDQAAQAHQYMENNDNFGKIVLEV